METNDYIESGVLELYVYGLLTDDENVEVSKMAKKHPEVAQDILEIEMAVINLSASFAPYLSVENYYKIREKLQLKHGYVDDTKPSRSIGSYFAWAAILVLLLGIGYLYSELQESYDEVVVIENEKSKMQQAVDTLKIEKLQFETALATVRDTSNTVVNLAGQAISPKSAAKVLWNRQTLAVHVDATGLPEPPDGMVYQVWALKLDPLTPTSLGLLENFHSTTHRIFAISSAENAEAFGITLEPAGGSSTPTLEQLYALGKV